MSDQNQLFRTDGPPALPEYIEARQAPAEDRKRLSGHNLAIYKRLQQGSATNTELAEMSLNHTARISNIRRWLDGRGSIQCERIEGGLTRYTLTEGNK